MSKKLTEHDTVKTDCSSCNKIKEHAVIAVVDEETVRIQCLSCDNEQDYEKVTSKKHLVKSAAAKKTKPSPRKADPAAAETKEWLQLRPDMKADQAIAYDMNGNFKPKSLLLHSSFGLGLVTRVAGPHKVEVLFESGKKLLRCH